MDDTNDSVEQVRQRLLEQADPSWPKDHEQRLQILEKKVDALLKWINHGPWLFERSCRE